jgi:ketosteroid isomerase-like protein
VASANLELVRSVCAAWEGGDFSRASEWAHPEIEFVIADGSSPGCWTGLDGLAESWRDFLSAWQDVRQDTEVYRQLDGERVLVLTCLMARGKTSGLEVGLMRTKQAGLFHVRAGKVTRLVYYLNRERAFADLGLTLETGSPSV